MANGYAEIVIKEQKIGLKYGMQSLRMIQTKNKDVKLIDDNRVLTEIGIAYILYAGYVNCCIIKEKITDLTFEDFYNYTESVLYGKGDKKELWSAVSEFMGSKTIFGEKTDEKPDEEIKKKKRILTK